jgi:hypothetical protein
MHLPILCGCALTAALMLDACSDSSPDGCRCVYYDNRIQVVLPKGWVGTADQIKGTGRMLPRKQPILSSSRLLLPAKASVTSKSQGTIGDQRICTGAGFHVGEGYSLAWRICP